MPALGLGTWQVRNFLIFNVKCLELIILPQSTQKDLEKALNTALKIGYRHIDTAILYENENIIGEVVNKWLTSGKLNRNELFITTKLPPMGMYPEKVEHYLESSLKNLKLNYVDLYLIHSPEGIKQIPENREALEMDENIDHLAVWKVSATNLVLFEFNNEFLEVRRASETWKSKIYWSIQF